MKNNNLFILILAFILAFYSFNASAECDGFYIAGRVGYAEYELDDDRGRVSNSYSNYIIDKKRTTVSAAIGYRHKHIRAELEYTWRDKNKGTIAGVTKGEFQSQSYMVIVYYDFFPYSWFTPYIDAGLGYTKHRLSSRLVYSDVNHKLKEDNFTWSLGAGLSAKITNRLNMDVGYRYYNMGDLSTFNGDTEVTDQEVYLGLRYVL